jgi:hypothetical protein
MTGKKEDIKIDARNYKKKIKNEEKYNSIFTSQ